MKAADVCVGIKVLGCGALCASAAFYAACGDDAATPSAPVDAGALDATTGPTDAATSPIDAQGGDAGGGDAADMDAGADAAPWCGNQRDGGALCASGQWRSFPAPVADAGDAGPGTCMACPTTALTCASAVLTVVDGGATFTPPQYDKVTNQLKLTIPPGQLEILSVTDATVVMASNCYGGPIASPSGPQPVPVTVDGNSVTFDLSGTDAGTGSSVGPCGAIAFTVHDACCTTSQVTVNAYFDLEGGHLSNGGCPDGG